jgi:hypothetical protein
VLPSQPLSRGSAEAAIVDHSGQVQIRGRGGNRSRRKTTGLGGEMDRAMASGVVVDGEKQQSDETDAWPWRLVPTCRSHARIFRRWPCAHWLCPLGRPDPLFYFGHVAIYLCYVLCNICTLSPMHHYQNPIRGKSARHGHGISTRRRCASIPRLKVAQLASDVFVTRPYLGQARS